MREEPKVPFRMPVEDVFEVNRCIVIGGRVEQGTVCGGDVIEISGDDGTVTATVARVEFLCWRGVGEPTGWPGDNVGLRLRKVSPGQIRVGWIAIAVQHS